MIGVDGVKDGKSAVSFHNRTSIVTGGRTG